MKHKLKLALILGVEFVAIAIVLILIFFSGKKQYTVIFDVDGGTVLSGSVEQRVTQGHAATPPAVVKEGHYLRGWSGNYREITHNIEITAIWEYETTPGIIYSNSEDLLNTYTYTEITGCFKHLAGNVYIGAYHNDLKVLAIGDGAFEDCEKITKLHLLDGILNIGSRAFANCSQMVSIELPDTALKIGNEAFYGCTSLESITLPESLEELGANAFMGCDALVEVRIPATIKKINESAFEGCDSLKKVTFYDVEEKKDIFAEEDDDENEIEKPVEPYLVIARSAFADCTALESINLPDTLHSLQTYAFSNCTSLKSIVIPKNTKLISNSVFDTSSITVYVYAENEQGIPSEWASNWITNKENISYGYKGENLTPPTTEENE